MSPADWEPIDMCEGTIDFSGADRLGHSRAEYHMENYPRLTIEPVEKNVSALNHS